MPEVDNIVYRTTTVDFTGKGSELTLNEGDYNWFKIASDVNNLFTQMASVGSGIASITQPTPGTLLITLTDLTTFGPFTLPISPMNGRGEWLPNTAYAVNDLIYYGNSFYVVVFAHTSEATFDPGANDGSGNNFYDLVFDFSLSATTLRQVTSYTEAGTTHTISSADPGTLWLCTNASGCQVLIPNDTTYDAPIDTEVSFRQSSTGAVYVTAQSPATYNTGVTAFTNTTAELGDLFTIKKIASNTWIGWGRFT